MRMFSMCGRLGVVLLAVVTVAGMAADPAEAKKRGSSKSSASRSATCCVVIGQYQPRIEGRFTKDQRFHLATSYRSGN